MDYSLGYGPMDLDDINLNLGGHANAVPVHVPYSGPHNLPPPSDMMSTLPIPVWNRKPGRRQPPDLLGRDLSLAMPVPGAPPDTFSPISPVAGQPLSNEKIHVQHRRDEVFKDPIDPALHYGNPPPCPAPWGRLMRSGEPVFTYTGSGELKHDRVFSRSQMREYLYGRQCGKCEVSWVSRQALPGELLIEGKHRHGLTLWIGWTPTQVNHRYPSSMSNKCRFADCAFGTRTIKSGQLRVAFDERMNVDGRYDPFHCAGYVHLFCLEKHFDVLKLMDDLDVRLDRRVFEKEVKNLADLDIHGSGRVRAGLNWLSAEWPRLGEHEDYISRRRANGEFLTRSQTERPRHFDDSLTKAIMVYDNAHYQASGRKMRRRRRRRALEEAAAQGTQVKEICDGDTHMGNLDYVHACEFKRRNRGNKIETVPPEEEPMHPPWLENPVPPDNYAPWMFTDGFIPGRIERLVPREPIGGFTGQYFPRASYDAPARGFDMTLCQPEITQPTLGPNLLESEYGDYGNSPYWFDPNSVQSNSYGIQIPAIGGSGTGQPVYAPPYLNAMPTYLPNWGLDMNVGIETDLEPQGFCYRPPKRDCTEDDAANDEGSCNPKRICLDPWARDEPVVSQPSSMSIVPEGSIDPWARVEPVRSQPPETEIPKDDNEELDSDPYINCDGNVDDLFADDGSFDFCVDITTTTEHSLPKHRPSPITVMESNSEASDQCGNKGEQPRTAFTFSLCPGADDKEPATSSPRRTRSI